MLQLNSKYHFYLNNQEIKITNLEWCPDIYDKEINSLKIYYKLNIGETETTIKFRDYIIKGDKLIIKTLTGEILELIYD